MRCWASLKARKRELIDTGIDKRYVRRNKRGTSFVESDDVGRSLAADRRKRAKTKLKSGQGDKGDRAKTKRKAAGKSRKKAVTRKGAARKSARKKGAKRVRVEDGTATIRTRNGHDYASTFPEMAKVARGFDNCIIDGEICAIGKDGLTDFSALQAAMKRDKSDKLILFAFDLLFTGNDDPPCLPLMECKAELRTLLEANLE